jgi:UMF1 family MFS transporter
MTIVVVSQVMFASGENLISAFLPEIVPHEQIGRMSGFGWGLGYIGGLTTLAVCLGYISWATGRGAEEVEFVPVTLLITATIFALAAAPTFFWLQERAVPTPSSVSYLRIGFRRVRETFRHASRFRDLFRFLLALVVFQSGVNTVIVLAAVYAREVAGFESEELIFLIMVVNVAAAAGSFLMGFMQDRLGSVRALSFSLILWICAIALVYSTQSKIQFWVAAHLIGLAMGASQAGGRALVGRFTPIARTGEFFGLWGLASRLASIIGPMSYGVIVYVTGGNQRVAMLSTLAFFVSGLVLLIRVNEARGVRTALGFNQSESGGFYEE